MVWLRSLSRAFIKGAVAFPFLSFLLVFDEAAKSAVKGKRGLGSELSIRCLGMKGVERATRTRPKMLSTAQMKGVELPQWLQRMSTRSLRDREAQVDGRWQKRVRHAPAKVHHPSHVDIAAARSRIPVRQSQTSNFAA